VAEHGGISSRQRNLHMVKTAAQGILSETPKQHCQSNIYAATFVLFFVFLVVMGCEPRALCLLGRGLLVEPCPQPLMQLHLIY
jgi:hypothetical protein